MKKFTQLCSMLLAVVAIVLFLLLGYLLMRHDIFLPKSTILSLLLIILLCSYIALRLIHKTCYIWHILFFLYATGLCYLLFFSKEFARDRIDYFAVESYWTTLEDQWSYAVNLKPFATIESLLGVWNSPWYGDYSFTNLIGNLVAFLPFACFVRMFYPNLKARSFFGYMSLLIIAVECLQLLSFTGSMDIDDYLLNISGAMLGFAVCSIPFIKNLLMKLKHLDK